MKKQEAQHLTCSEHGEQIAQMGCPRCMDEAMPRWESARNIPDKSFPHTIECGCDTCEKHKALMAIGFWVEQCSCLCHACTNLRTFYKYQSGQRG